MWAELVMDIMATIWIVLFCMVTVAVVVAVSLAYFKLAKSILTNKFRI